MWDKQNEIIIIFYERLPYLEILIWTSNAQDVNRIAHLAEPSALCHSKA